jgi:transposase
MANKTKTMLQIRRIVQLLQQEKTIGSIARELSIAINTVKKYRKHLLSTGLEFSQLINLDDTSLQLIIYPQKANQKTNNPDRQLELQQLLPNYVKRLQSTHITRELLWKEYRGLYSQGYGYSQFCDYLYRYFLHHKAVMHMEHKPGEILQIDFAGDKLSYIDKKTGEIIQCPILVCTMPFSSFTYLEALPNQSQIHLIAALNRCLTYLGGVPRNIKSDNLKQVVTKANRYEPVFSEVIDQFALYYNTSFTASRVFKPKDKATVERHVGIAYQRIYSVVEQKTCFSLQELNAQIFELLETLNNTQMQKKEYSRSERFNEMERPVLSILPENPYEIKHQAVAKVMRNYHVILGEDWHNYSVPYQYIGKKVMLVYDYQNVEIYHDLERIAIHPRMQRKHGYSTQTNHMPANHQAAKQAGGYTSEYFLKQAQNIGDNTFKVIEKIIAGRYFSQQSYNSCLGILRLKEKYTKERLEKACQIALSCYRINYQTISNILSNNRDKLETQTSPIIITQKVHENIRGKETYRTLFDQITN